MERLAVGWLIWEMTGSATWVGVVAGLRMGPSLVLGPIGGILSDRAGSIRLLRICHLGNAAILLGMAIGAMEMPTWLIAAAVGALGILQGMAAAPIKTVITQIVPRPLLTAAIPLSSATFQMAAFVGPAAAGLAIATMGIGFALAAAALGHLFFVFVLRLWSDADEDGHGSDGTALSGLAMAFRLCATDAVLAPVFALHLAAALLLRPLIDMLPIVVGRLGAGGAMTLGILTAASGAGALSGALWMATSSRTALLARRTLVGSAVAACGLAMLGACVAMGSVVVAVPVLFVFGFALTTRATAGLTLIQLAAAHPYRGRIVGFYTAILRGGTAIGAVFVGLLADLAGLTTALFCAAALTGLMVIGFARPLLRPTPDVLDPRLGTTSDH